MDFKEFLKNAAYVVPSENQLRHLRETPFYAFIHFCPNTYTNLENQNIKPPIATLKSCENIELEGFVEKVL